MYFCWVYGLVYTHCCYVLRFADDDGEFGDAFPGVNARRMKIISVTNKWDFFLACVHVFMCSGFHVFRFSRVQVFTCSGFHVKRLLIYWGACLFMLFSQTTISVIR